MKSTTQPRFTPMMASYRKVENTKSALSRSPGGVLEYLDSGSEVLVGELLRSLECGSAMARYNPEYGISLSALVDPRRREVKWHGSTGISVIAAGSSSAVGKISWVTSHAALERTCVGALTKQLEHTAPGCLVPCTIPGAVHRSIRDIDAAREFTAPTRQPVASPVGGTTMARAGRLSPAARQLLG